MQFWHWLILGNVLLAASGQYVGKIMVGRLHPYQILFYQYIASIITLSVYIKFLRPYTSFYDVPFWFIIIGFMYAFGITCLYHAKKQSLSKTAMAKRFSAVITIFLAVIFLGEYALLSLGTPVGAGKLVGLSLALLMMFLLYQEKTHVGSEKSFDYKLWVKWILPMILIMGVAQFIVKYAVGSHDPLQLLRLQYIGSFLVIFILLFFTKKDLRIGWKNILGCSVVGIFISSALSFLYTALAVSSAVQVLPIAAIASIIVITFLGVVFFKEKITKRIALPFILGLISIYLLR